MSQLATTALALLAALGGSASARGPSDESAEVTQLLERVAAAYVAAPGLSDSFTAVIAFPGRGEQEMSGHVRMAPGGDFEARTLGMSMTLTRVGGQFTIELDDVEGKAVGVELGDDVLGSMRESLDRMSDLIPAQIVLGLGGGWDKVLSSLALGFVKEAQPSSHRMVERDGTEVHEVLFEQDSGSGQITLQIDTASLLIVGCQAEGSPAGAPADVRVSVDIGFTPVVTDALDEPITIDADLELLGSIPELIKEMQKGGQSINPSVAVGEPAPGFELIDQDGVTHKLSDYRGKLVLLDFWGVWCPPCVASLPAIQEMSEAYAGRDIVILALNVQDENSKMEAFWEEKGMTFPSLHDAEKVAAEYGIKAFPSSVLIDEQGVVVHATVGPAHDLEHMVDERLEAGAGS